MESAARQIGPGGTFAATRLPAASFIALATTATAWPAAGYGALVIWAAGDFTSTGTLWVFGWPFLVQLVCGSSLHLLAAGLGARWGIPPLIPGIGAFDRALAHGDDLGSCDVATLRAALAAAVRLPVWNEVLGLALSSFVVLSSVTIERLAAGGVSPNTWVILRGGLYATALYGAASLALCELLTRRPCRQLRRAAAAAGIEPYGGFTLAPGWRVATMVVPTMVALMVAVEIGLSANGGTVVYAELIALSALVAIALNWLQYANGRSAVRELRDACRDLAAGHEADLITGSIEPTNLEMAREFTTAVRHVGARRRASGERYRAVFEAALDCIITMDHEGRIVEFNPAAERVFGYGRAQVVGRNLADAIVPAALRAAHAAGLARYLTTGEALLLGRRIELRAMRADGSEFPVEIAITRIQRDGPPMFTAHLRDITERKRVEEALTASKRHAEEQAEIAAALLRVGETINAHLNRPDLLQRVSRLTVEVLGCDASSILVRDRKRQGFVLRADVGAPPDVVAEVEHLAFTPETFPLLRALRAGEVLELPDVLPSAFPERLARHRRVASALAAPIARGEEIVGLVVATYHEPVGAFTAKQRRLALGVAHTTAVALENARLIGDLQAASRLKTEFVSTMSHELRTPLNVILGFCEIARGATSPDELETCHQRIELAGRTLLELIEGTLEVGKLEAGRDDVQLETVDLAALWNKLKGEYAGLRRDGKVVLDWTPGVTDALLVTDPRKVAMIVRNLVGNALKFTDRGFVRAEAWCEDAELALRISDSGIGIDPQDQEKIFDMFCQADGSDSRRYGGTGLGLYIVRRFVQQLGGRVDLDSGPGRGSVFTVRLPVIRAAGENLPAPGWPRSAAASRRG